MRNRDLLSIMAVTLMAAPLAISCGLQVHPQTEGLGITGAGGAGEPSGSGGQIVSGSGGSDGAGGAVPTDGGPGPDLGMTGSGGTPVSGGFVDLKGTMVPTEKAIAFIHFGHSNMAGRGRAPTSLRPYNFTDVDPRAWMHHTAGQRTGFNPALEPYTAGDSASISSMTGGPGTPLVKEAVKLAGPGYHFISLGFASNGSYCRQFAAANYFNAIMASPRALKGKVTFGAIVVMLGITERHGTDQDIANYAECINGIVTRIRTELGLTPKQLPLLITDYEMTADNSRGEDLRPTGPFGRLMVPSIRRVPSVVAESALVETEGLAIVDDHHYQLDAHQIWVQRALAHMKEKGWWHWGP